MSAPAAALLFGHRLPLREYDPPPPDAAPFVSVIIPARNEAHRIGRCVRSILASSYPSYEVIVVDDRSTDGTGAVVGAIAATDARLCLVTGSEVPGGWFGKPWACRQGASVARGTVLLFTDADTWHGPELLGRAVGMMLARGADLVSLLQRQEMSTFWERVTQPHLFAVIGVPAVLLAGGTPENINQNQDVRGAIANGQFILVTRSSYEAIGGHEAVKGEVVEDLMIARRYAEAGRKRWIANAMDDMSTRMYWSLGELVEGWSKNLFVAAQILWGPLGGYLGMLGLGLIVCIGFLPVIALVATALGAGPAVAAFAVTGFALGALGTGTFLRTNREPPWYGLFFWAGQLVLLFILIRSTIRGKRRIEWKGRTYRHA